MSHRIIDVGSTTKHYVLRGRCYSWLDLWTAGLASHGGSGWS